MDSSQSPKTKLLTLLNVSATKPGKRKRAAHAHYQEITRKAIKAAQSGAADRLGEEEPTPESADADVRARAHNRSFKSSANNGGTSELSLGPAQEDVSDDDEPANGGAPKVRDVFDAHFASEGPDALALSKLPASAEEISWVQKRVTAGPLGGLVTARPEGVEEGTGSLEGKVSLSRLATCTKLL